MKEIVYQDEFGKKHRVLLRDEDDPNNVEMGVPKDPFALDHVNCNELTIALWNRLVDLGVYDYRSFATPEVAMSVSNLVRRFVQDAFRSMENKTE